MSNRSSHGRASNQKVLPFYPLFYIRLESDVTFGSTNEGLYIMTRQNEKVDTGIIIGLTIGDDRIAKVIIIPEYSRQRSNPFPERRFLTLIQLRDQDQLSDFFKSRHQPNNLTTTPANSPEELEIVRNWFSEAARDLKTMK